MKRSTERHPDQWFTVKERWDEMSAGDPTRFTRYNVVAASKVVCEPFMVRTVRG